jgi:hypothetical protein
MKGRSAGDAIGTDRQAECDAALARLTGVLPRNALIR